LREIWGGFIMALRRWPTLLALAGMIAAACVVMTIALGDVLFHATAISSVQQLRERHVVTFYGPYYTRRNLELIDVGEDTIRLLIGMIDRQEAYTAIVGNLRWSDPDFAGGHHSIALFGEAVFDLFPELKPDRPTPLPFAMRGAKLADQNIDSLSLAGETIPVVETLPAGAIFFDMNAGAISLDRHIVILAPARMLPLLCVIELQEALGRAVLFAPTDEVVDAYVSGNAQGGMIMVPYDLDMQLQRVNKFLMGSAVYIVGMLAFFALVLAAFVSSARLTLRQEMRAFKIREMYGATATHVGLRIGGFLTTVVLAPPAVLLSFLALIGGHYAVAALWVMLAIIINFVFLWFTSVRQIRVQDQFR